MIYLASSSPRRRMLLKKARIPFKLLRPAYEERPRKGETPLGAVRRHALGKALSVMARVKKGVILGCDTVVVSRGRLLGKPATMRAAQQMLKSLEGRVHAVVSAVALIRMEKAWPQKQVIFTEKSRVRIKRMSGPERRAYLRRIGPLDKAGAYAAQAPGKGVVLGVSGSFTNVVGLPMEKLKKNLRMLR